MIIFWAIQDERDQLKIESLYYQYRYLMYSEANKILHDNYLAEDAVQQACLKIIDNLHKIDEINCPRTRNFVVIICRSVTLNILKKRLYINKKDNCIEEFEDDTKSISNNPMNIVIDQESVNRITSAIEGLKPIYKDVLLLKSTYGCNNEKISNIMELPIETIKKRLFRARKLLIQILEKEESK